MTKCFRDSQNYGTDYFTLMKEFCEEGGITNETYTAEETLHDPAVH